MAGGTCCLTLLGHPEVLGPGVFPSLFFADEWIFVLGFGFEDKQREALGIDLEKSPAPRFEQLVDLDAGGGFLMGHSGSCSRDGGQAAFGVPDWVTKGLGLRITASNEGQSYFPLYRKRGK